MTKKNQSFITVDATVLGIKKPIIVFESNRNYLLSMGTQMTLMQMEDKVTDETDSVKILQTYTDAIEKQVNFLQRVLKLTTTQADAVYDLTQQETIDLVMQVINKVMHTNEEPEVLEEEKTE